MITRVLVANRGEIARRVFATCRLLGIGCVAVHSDADAQAPHVAEADAAVRLPGSAAADTYLRTDLLVQAALRAGADAVHPGYGFGAENASFAAAVQAAGLIWIGPPPQVIAAMGSKTAAKKAVEAAGVPVLADLDPAMVSAADLPVLVKASAGGGGRGLRVVRDLAELPAALAAASAEAASAFGDGTVFVEPYLERARHVEVQVLADEHGTIWALGERECSLQRRHQKVLEESPSPLLQAVPGVREGLEAAALATSRAVGYVGAGTVEFLLDAPQGLASSAEAVRFFFLETNTRLQVEHSVTECRFGVDLIALQFAIASGSRLAPQPPVPRGHAIEVRLYAEDPAANWAPQTGRLHAFEVPGVDARFCVPTRASLPVLRLDAGVEPGSVVGPHYDPMLAKLVVWAPEREAAAARLAAALSRSRLHGVRTNRDLLVRVLRDERFLAADTETSFLARDLDRQARPLADEKVVRLCALAAALADAEAHRAAAGLPGVPAGWRNVPAVLRRKEFRHAGGELAVEYASTRDGLTARIAGRELDGVALVVAHPARVILESAGVRYGFDVAAYPGLVCVDSPLGSVELIPLERLPDKRAALDAGSLVAPMPAVVARLGVSVGERVRAGAPVLWLEAMKMEHELTAPVSGLVTAMAAEVGMQVEAGALLAVLQVGATDPAVLSDEEQQ